MENTSYTPFGVIIDGGNETRYDYEGKEYDDVLDQYDFHFRGYKAEWGKFTQPDTIIQDVYDPQELNHYAFERNNPYRYTDPDGHEPITAIIITYYVIAATITLVSTGIVLYDSYKNPEHRDQNIKELLVTAGLAAATLPKDPSGMTALGITAVGSVLSAKSALDRLDDDNDEDDEDPTNLKKKEKDATFTSYEIQENSNPATNGGDGSSNSNNNQINRDGRGSRGKKGSQWMSSWSRIVGAVKKAFKRRSSKGSSKGKSSKS